MSDDSVYLEICQNIRTTDDISFKLLGLVPLVSGAGIVVALLNSDLLWSPAIYLIALLGAGITFGLFRWELKNILICNWLIHCAQAMEYRALQEEHVGQFYRRPEPPSLFQRKPGAKERGEKSGESEETGGRRTSSFIGSLRRTSIRSLGKISSRKIFTRQFGKTEAEKLVYSLAMFSWLTLPLVVFVSTDPGSHFAPLGWTVISTALYVLLAIVLVILTLSALRAEVTDRSPMTIEEAKEHILPIVADRFPERVAVNQPETRS
jgi:hypothetical protein